MKPLFRSLGVRQSTATPGDPRPWAGGRSVRGVPLRPWSSVRAVSRGSGRSPRGRAAGGARGVPAGGGGGQRSAAGALQQGGTRLHNEPRACPGSSSSPLPPAPPPSPFIYFIYFYFIYLFVLPGIIKKRKSERCFWLLSTNLSVTQAETT